MPMDIGKIGDCISYTAEHRNVEINGVMHLQVVPGSERVYQNGKEGIDMGTVSITDPKYMCSPGDVLKSARELNTWFNTTERLFGLSEKKIAEVRKHFIGRCKNYSCAKCFAYTTACHGILPDSGEKASNDMLYVCDAARRIVKKYEKEHEAMGKSDKDIAHSILEQNGIHSFSNIAAKSGSSIMCAGVACNADNSNSESCPIRVACVKDDSTAQDRLRKAWEIAHGPATAKKPTNPLAKDAIPKDRRGAARKLIELGGVCSEGGKMLINCMECPMRKNLCGISSDEESRKLRVKYAKEFLKMYPDDKSKEGATVNCRCTLSPEYRSTLVKEYREKRKTRHQVVLSKMTTE